MKHLKRSILALAMAIIPFHSHINGCADTSEDYNYYNLFDQLLLENKGLRPYLLTLDEPLYNAKDSLPDENLNAWGTFFKKNNIPSGMSKEQFKTMLYSASLQEMKRPSSPYVIALSKTEGGKQVLAYLQYAKELEPYAQIGEDGDWYQLKRTASPSEDTYNHYKNKGIAQYRSTPYNELKLRYAYQLVRLAHYMRNKNNDAILMYNQYVKPVQQEHYIYYAALEQTAGALYNIGRLANANYLYSRVFDHSDNRKEVAYNSFRIQNGVDWNEAMSWCKNDRERAAMYALRGYNQFANELEEVENILKIQPQSPYIKSLAIRYINKIERKLLSKYNIRDSEERINVFMCPDNELLAEYQRAQKVIKAVMVHPNAPEKTFWALYHAHLSFLCKDYRQAAELLNSVQTMKPELLRQKARTQFGLYLAQLKFIGKEEENNIRTYLHTCADDAEFANEIIGHIYKMQGDYGKAFLAQNHIGNLRQNPDLQIINSLLDNVEKENNQPLLTQLYELKGTHYLRMNQFEEAAKWYAKVPQSYQIMRYEYNWDRKEYVPIANDPDQFNGYSHISPLIFSNGFKRWFDVPAETQLNDVLYKQYKYLNREHDKATLTSALIQLEKESSQMTEKGAKAAYLLANYYYNISPTGYYRNIPNYYTDNSYYSSAYEPYGSTPGGMLIPDFSKAYNYRDFTWEHMIVDNMEKALALYQQAATYFTDREWQARALFMASSCTMNLYAQDWWYSLKEINKVHRTRSDEEKKVDDYFHRLATTYGNTQFFRQAVHECKYFDFYVKTQL